MSDEVVKFLSKPKNIKTALHISDEFEGQGEVAEFLKRPENEVIAKEVSDKIKMVKESLQIKFWGELSTAIKSKKNIPWELYENWSDEERDRWWWPGIYCGQGAPDTWANLLSIGIWQWGNSKQPIWLGLCDDSPQTPQSIAKIKTLTDSMAKDSIYRKYKDYPYGPCRYLFSPEKNNVLEWIADDDMLKAKTEEFANELVGFFKNYSDLIQKANKTLAKQTS